MFVCIYSEINNEKKIPDWIYDKYNVNNSEYDMPR